MGFKSTSLIRIFVFKPSLDDFLRIYLSGDDSPRLRVVFRIR